MLLWGGEMSRQHVFGERIGKASQGEEGCEEDYQMKVSQCRRLRLVRFAPLPGTAVLRFYIPLLRNWSRLILLRFFLSSSLFKPSFRSSGTSEQPTEKRRLPKPEERGFARIVK